MDKERLWFLAHRTPCDLGAIEIPRMSQGEQPPYNIVVTLSHSPARPQLIAYVGLDLDGGRRHESMTAIACIVVIISVFCIYTGD